MLGSISPVGETSRRQRWWLTATAYTVASLAAGAAIGAALGGFGQLVLSPVSTTIRLLVLAIVTAAAAASDAGLLGPLPTWRRQVDERWLTTYRGWVYGAGFGLQLGLGVATIVTSAVTYAALAAALLAASWQAGAVVGAMFGLARSLPLLAMARVRSADRLYAVTQRVAEAQPAMRRAGVVCLAVLSAVAVGGMAL